ncbi:LsmAD domain-containing protein [Mycena kentingensis (nom. inval.)]|nr:LsmAD domain-containing protein [Mycena kentingensis (nom. inval.)]
MASTARQPKPRKGGPEPARRQPAWTGARASPTFSASPSATPQPPPPSFPPLNGAQDKVLQSLAGLTGTTITLSTKTNVRYEGVIASTSNEGDTTGVTLRDLKDLSNPGGPLKDSLFIAATNIADWSSGPADAKAPNGDSFRTDADISAKKGAGRERELQAWQPSTDIAPNANAGGLGGDDETFGAGSTKGNWDQFNANEKLFGVKTSFDEDVYTTKLDRNAPDFKERERKAQRIANEIQMSGTSNPHIAEERNHNVDDSGVNEEDKYGAVVRGAGAYVPPGARRPDAPKTDVPKVSVNGPDGASVVPSQAPSKSPSPGPAGSTKQPDPVTAFSDFVTNEKQRLQQKRQQMVKSDMDKRVADLVKFSQSFKLNKPIPDDLVSILTKDVDKQRQIKEKSTVDANAPQARNIGASSSSTTVPGAPRGTGPALAAKISPKGGAPAKTAAATAKPAAAKPAVAAAAPAPKLAPTGKPAIPMVIQSIPPFKGAKTRQSSHPTMNGAASSPRPPNMATSATMSTLASAAPPSPKTAAANRLNVNATSFKPISKGTPSASASPKPKTEAPAAPNPFFGPRIIKKNTAAHIKDDFNPFKHNKVVEAAQVSAMWPYNGKRYMLMFPQQTPQPPHPQQPSPHVPPPNAAPMPAPPPPYPGTEEDPAAAAARGYVYYPYYPGQMMPPGMMPPGPPYVQYMQPMYPPGMPPPNAMYPSPSMGQMPPPPQLYMQPPPPGAYPPPNGAARPSMPPTPIPGHPHPYYQQSPQLAHAVPVAHYPMMMGQPPTGPVHPYDGSQGQMGQHS